jgi:uncharacterized membrane protein
LELEFLKNTRKHWENSASISIWQEPSPFAGWVELFVVERKLDLFAAVVVGEPPANEVRKENIMSDLVVIGFDNEHTAFEMRAELVKLQKEYLIEMEDVVVVTKDDKGKVKLHQAANLTAAGAVGGSFWGMLIGMIFLNPLLGAAVGAGAGALSGKLSDIGISDNFMKELGETIKNNTSALFVLVRKATPDKILEELKGFKGNFLKTSLTKDKEDELREVLEKA